MSEPLPVPNSPAGTIPDRRFVARLFADLAPRYNGILQGYSFGQDLRWKEVLVRKLHPVPGERALDLACGTGLILDRLSKVLGESHVLGIDINRPMLLEMRRTGSLHTVVQSTAERLPVRSNWFDLVTSGYLLKYVRLDRFLSEVARVLKPGGRFGGYDFSRPLRGTPAGKLYEIYLHRMMPRIGRARAGGAESWRAVFDFLPTVAESSGWEDRVGAALKRAGFTEVRLAPSLGGVITWVWAQKRTA